MQDTEFVDVGIDPGLSGAIAVLRGGRAEVHRMPIRKRRGKGNEVDLQRVAGILRPHFRGREIGEVGITIEQAQTMRRGRGNGASSVMTIGRNYGMLLGLELVAPRPNEVHPATWKKALGIQRGADKSASVARAKELFPAVSLVFPRCTTEHDGAAEALLIAYYGREKRQGNPE